MKEFVFDLRRFDEDKSSLGGLTLLNNVVETLGLKKLAEALQKSDKDPWDYLKSDASPILKFVGTYLEAKAKKDSDTAAKIKGFTMITASAIAIIDSAAKIFKYSKEKNPPAEKISMESGLIVSEVTNIANEVVKLKSGDKSFVLSIVASAISLIANGLSALDGVTEDEKDKINASYLGFMKVLNRDLVKKLFNAAIASTIESASVKDLEVVKNNMKLLNSVSETLTKTGGVLDLVFAAAEGFLNGIKKYKATLKTYAEDGIPEDLAGRDAFINAFTAVIQDTAHAYTKGIDDVVYRGAQTLVSFITGREAIAGNYVEVMTEMFKAFNYTNTGDEEDNFLLSHINDTMIYGAGGNDYIANIASNVQIYGGHDDDTLVSRLGTGDGYSTPQGNSILGGPGNDLIMAYDKNSSIDGGDGADRIAVFGTDNKIYGSAGNDVILIKDGADRNTVSGGHGDDVIILESVQNAVIEYSEGDGNDIILGFDENDVIHVLSDYSTSTSGQDAIIAVGTDSITLSGAAGKEIIINGTKNLIGEPPTNPPLIIILPSVWYEGTNEIRGTAGDDKIYNSNDSVMINSGAGNDSVRNQGDWNSKLQRYVGGSSVTINTGGGDDSIRSYGDDVSINSGDGDDFISNYHSDSVTIDTGAGNDTVRNQGDWNSKLQRYVGGSSVTINTGAGDDYIFNDSGSSVTINTGAGNDSIYNYTGKSVTINTGEDDDYIYNSGSSIKIDGGAGNDNFGNAGASVTIDGGVGDDAIESSGKNVTISGGEGDDYILNESGDSVSIDGGAGNDYINNHYSDSVSVSGGAGNDSIKNEGDNVTFKYSEGDGNDTIEGFNATSTLSIAGGTYSTTKSGNNVIVTVGEGKITLVGAANLSKLNIDGEEYNPTQLTLTNADNAKVTLGAEVITVDASARTSAIQITGNALNNSIVGGAKADTLDGGAGNDTLTGGYGADTFIYSGGKDTITDYGANFDKISLAGSGAQWLSQITGSSVSSPNVTLTFSNNSNKTLTLNGAANKKVIVNGATRIFGNNVIYTGDKKSATLTSNFSGTFNASGYSTVNASAAQAVTISGASSIVGSSKADCITGTAGNDTLTGGYGADTFIYTGGKDTITDYGANFDKVSLAADGAKWLSHITGAAVSGSNVTLTFSKDSSKTLTLNGAANKKVIVNGTTRIFGNNVISTSDKKGATLTSNFRGTFNASGYSTVNASAAQAVTISGASSIVGSSKADCIAGTAGNDTLTGGYGADTFIYTGGKDTITDYGANFDKVSLAADGAKWLSHIMGVAVDRNKNVTLTFSKDSSKTLTLNGAAGKKVILNGATRIFEDGKIYTGDRKSSTVLSAAADVYWFDEDNFDAPQLDSLMETSIFGYSIGKLDTTENLTRLTKDEFILAFGKK